ncbi:hypothetical protein MKEN_01015100 [Mycena kentingensis (nom. inval.)]|nr:hypothetical protein MKEN_01015100 [Mycena kentingensis (nom. inval.)]
MADNPTHGMYSHGSSTPRRYSVTPPILPLESIINEHYGLTPPPPSKQAAQAQAYPTPFSEPDVQTSKVSARPTTATSKQVNTAPQGQTKAEANTSNSAARGKVVPTKAGRVRLHISNGKDVVKVEQKSNGTMGHCFEIYAKELGLERRLLRFHFHNKRINDTDTPEDLGMGLDDDDEDLEPGGFYTIDVMSQQLGG